MTDPRDDRVDRDPADTRGSPVQLERDGPVARLWMDRPDTHNAFDERLVDALIQALADCHADPALRVIVLGGHGRSFSAGADLAAMRRLGEGDPAANLAAARRMAGLFHALAHSPKPVVARVQGAAIGGGLGLAAACQVCIASRPARFAMSEVRLGLVPAVISPWVTRALGERQALRYALSGERFSAERAQALGLVHELCEAEALDATVQSLVEHLLAGAPQAQATTVALLRRVAGQAVDAALLDETAGCIARVRAAAEAAEGITAFLDHRPPAWQPPGPA